MNHDASLILPYTGLRILDISQGIAGPYCAHILWQQGADVTKVEPPSGDWGRFVGVVRGEHSALSIQYNAGKRSIAIDGKVAAGRALLRQLALQADIVVQNFRPGVAERIGLGYAELAALKPDLLYVSISGYGPDGPYAEAPASDSVMQADSGLMVTNQDQHGVPRRIGMLMADVATGLYAAQAASAALYQRLARGVGCHVEVSLFEACASLQGINFLEHAMAGQRPFGAVSAPNGVFETADGQLTLLALNNDQFARVCRALGQKAWLTDVRFTDNTLRMAHAEFLHAAINTLLKLQPTAFWLAQLIDKDHNHDSYEYQQTVRRVLYDGYADLGLSAEQAAHPDAEVYHHLQFWINRDKLIDATHQHVDGTSVSVTMVSAIVAQMLEVRPDLTPAQVKSILTETATLFPAMAREQQGGGIINPAYALSALMAEQTAAD